MKQGVMLLITLMLVSFGVSAQDLKSKQRQQEKTIKATFKAKKITGKEYDKLMDEQEVIKRTIEKYELDGQLDSHEKNVIHDKLERAARRLKRYKTNGEVY